MDSLSHGRERPWDRVFTTEPRPHAAKRGARKGAGLLTGHQTSAWHTGHSRAANPRPRTGTCPHLAVRALAVRTSRPCLPGLDCPREWVGRAQPRLSSLDHGVETEPPRPLPSLTPPEPTAPQPGPNALVQVKVPCVPSPGSTQSALPLWTLPGVHSLGSAMHCRDERPPPQGDWPTEMGLPSTPVAR